MAEILVRTIKAVAPKKVELGEIGFLTNETPVWYNIFNEDSTKLQSLLDTIIQKGNKVQFSYEKGQLDNLELLNKATQEKSGNWADDMINFEDLLSNAHEKFGDKMNIKTELISMDYEKKQALFSACVSIEYGEDIRLFTGHGDAEGISNDKIAPHFIRMAETRAVARALRFATNNAKVADVETA